MAEKTEKFQDGMTKGVNIVGGQEAKTIDQGTKVVGGKRPGEITTLDKHPEKS